MVMQRWDPFSEVMSLRDAMNRLMEESFVWPTPATAQGRMSVAVDVREQENEYIIEASLPGVKPGDIEVSVLGNQVSIQGEMKAEEEKEQGRYHVRERRAGRFQRIITLPTNINANNVSSQFEHGVLTLTLPKAEEARPRRIQITGGGQQQIEGQARQQTPQ